MNLKLELFYLRKACFEYHAPFKYLYNKYLIAPRILKTNKILDQPINHQDLSVHILTCHRDLVMFIWSLASFYKNMNIIGQLYIHSDGSLTQKDKSILNKLFPSAKIIEKKSDYQYLLLQKLFDPYYLSDKKIHLIIDSDLLWFKNSKEIEGEIKNNAQNSLMMVGQGIGCPVYFNNNKKLSAELSYLNSGIVLYHKDNFNLDKLEKYLAHIDNTNLANKHFVEQAGYASCLENIKPLPESKYIIKGPVQAETIVKHYTSPRRPLFYIEGLKILAKKSL